MSGLTIVAEGGPAAERVAAILADRVGERISLAPETPAPGGAAAVTVVLDPSADPRDGYRLEAGAQGARLVAATVTGLLAGAGELLRASAFEGDRWTLPELAVSRRPDLPIRPIYFATHFGNWYCHASVEDLRRYIEDLALWGYNQLVTWFDLHHYTDLEAGAADWSRLAELDRIARELGLRVGRIAIANESFDGQAPPSLRAEHAVAGSGYDTDLCPSIPEARRMILDDRRAWLEKIRDTTSIDWICLWPYDQGGCNCSRCAPWPATYMSLCEEIAGLARTILPDVEILVSAWWIGTHVAGEDEAFFAALGEGAGWFETIVAGTVEARRWLADGRRVPDPYGVLLFPEISMFDALPWGGRGANPAPRRFAAEMAELGPHIAGAMPYSEGRYEDINKAVWAQLQWDRTRDVESVVEDYARVYFGAEVAAEARELILDVEAGLRDLGTAPRRDQLARSIEARMPAWAREGWRWQVLRAHTEMDVLKAELEAGTAGAARQEEVRARLRAVHEDLQHRVYLHNERDSLRDWIYLPFDTWVTLPFNELVLPTAGALT